MTSDDDFVAISGQWLLSHCDQDISIVDPASDWLIANYGNFNTGQLHHVNIHPLALAVNGKCL